MNLILKIISSTSQDDISESEVETKTYPAIDFFYEDIKVVHNGEEEDILLSEIFDELGAPYVTFLRSVFTTLNQFQLLCENNINESTLKTSEENTTETVTQILEDLRDEAMDEDGGINHFIFMDNFCSKLESAIQDMNKKLKGSLKSNPTFMLNTEPSPEPIEGKLFLGETKTLESRYDIIDMDEDDFVFSLIHRYLDIFEKVVYSSELISLLKKSTTERNQLFNSSDKSEIALESYLRKVNATKVKVKASEIINTLKEKFAYTETEDGVTYELNDTIQAFALYQNELGKILLQTAEECNTFVHQYSPKTKDTKNLTVLRTDQITNNTSPNEISSYYTALCKKSSTRSPDKGIIEQVQDTPTPENLEELLLTTSILIKGISRNDLLKDGIRDEKLFTALGLYYLNIPNCMDTTDKDNKLNNLFRETVKLYSNTNKAIPKRLELFLDAIHTIRLHLIDPNNINSRCFKESVTSSLLINLAYAKVLGLDKNEDGITVVEASLQQQIGNHFQVGARKFTKNAKISSDSLFKEAAALNFFSTNYPTDTIVKEYATIAKNQTIRQENEISSEKEKPLNKVKTTSKTPANKGNLLVAQHYINIAPTTQNAIKTKDYENLGKLFIKKAIALTEKNSVNSRESSIGGYTKNTVDLSDTSDADSGWNPHDTSTLSALYDFLINTRQAEESQNNRITLPGRNTLRAPLYSSLPRLQIGDYKADHQFFDHLNTTKTHVDPTRANIDDIELQEIKINDLEIDIPLLLPPQNKKIKASEYVEKLNQSLQIYENYFTETFSKFGIINVTTIINLFKTKDGPGDFLNQVDNPLQITKHVYNYLLILNIRNCLNKAITKDGSLVDKRLIAREVRDALCYFKDPTSANDWIQLNEMLNVTTTSNIDKHDELNLKRLLNIIYVCEGKLKGANFSKEQLMVVKKMSDGEAIYKEAGFGKTMLEAYEDIINRGFSGTLFTLHIKPFPPETDHFLPIEPLSDMVHNGERSKAADKAHYYAPPERLTQLMTTLQIVSDSLERSLANATTIAKHTTIQIKSYVKLFCDEVHAKEFFNEGKSFLDEIGSLFYQCIGLTATPDTSSLDQKILQYTYSIYRNTIASTQFQDIKLFHQHLFSTTTKNQDFINTLFEMLLKKDMSLTLKQKIEKMLEEPNMLSLNAFETWYKLFTEIQDTLSPDDIDSFPNRFPDNTFLEFSEFYNQLFNIPTGVFEKLDELKTKDLDIKTLTTIDNLEESISYLFKLNSKFAEYFDTIKSNERTQLTHNNATDVTSIVNTSINHFLESKEKLKDKGINAQRYGMCIPSANIDDVIPAIELNQDLRNLALNETTLALVYRAAIRDKDNNIIKGELRARVLVDGNYHDVDYETILENQDEYTSICCYTTDSCGGDFEQLSRSLDVQFISLTDELDFNLSSTAQFMWRDRKPWLRHCKRMVSFPENVGDIKTSTDKQKFIDLIKAEQAKLSKIIQMADIYDNKSRHIKRLLEEAVEKLIVKGGLEKKYDPIKDLIKEAILAIIEPTFLGDRFVKKYAYNLDLLKEEILELITNSMEKIGSTQIYKWLADNKFMTATLENYKPKEKEPKITLTDDEKLEVYGALYPIFDKLTIAFRKNVPVQLLSDYDDISSQIRDFSKVDSKYLNIQETIDWINEHTNDKPQDRLFIQLIKKFDSTTKLKTTEENQLKQYLKQQKLGILQKTQARIDKNIKAQSKSDPEQSRTLDMLNEFMDPKTLIKQSEKKKSNVSSINVTFKGYIDALTETLSTTTRPQISYYRKNKEATKSSIDTGKKKKNTDNQEKKEKPFIYKKTFQRQITQLVKLSEQSDSHSTAIKLLLKTFLTKKLFTSPGMLNIPKNVNYKEDQLEKPMHILGKFEWKFLTVDQEVSLVNNLVANMKLDAKDIADIEANDYEFWEDTHKKLLNDELVESENESDEEEEQVAALEVVPTTSSPLPNVQTPIAKNDGKGSNTRTPILTPKTLTPKEHISRSVKRTLSEIRQRQNADYADYSDQNSPMGSTKHSPRKSLETLQALLDTQKEEEEEEEALLVKQDGEIGEEVAPQSEFKITEANLTRINGFKSPTQSHLQARLNLTGSAVSLAPTPSSQEKAQQKEHVLGESLSGIFEGEEISGDNSSGSENETGGTLFTPMGKQSEHPNWRTVKTPAAKPVTDATIQARMNDLTLNQESKDDSKKKKTNSKTVATKQGRLNSQGQSQLSENASYLERIRTTGMLGDHELRPLSLLLNRSIVVIRNSHVERVYNPISDQFTDPIYVINYGNFHFQGYVPNEIPTIQPNGADLCPGTVRDGNYTNAGVNDCLIASIRSDSAANSWLNQSRFTQNSALRNYLVNAQAGTNEAFYVNTPLPKPKPDEFENGILEIQEGTDGETILTEINSTGIITTSRGGYDALNKLKFGEWISQNTFGTFMTYHNGDGTNQQPRRV
jgi:hypothetical protein